MSTATPSGDGSLSVRRTVGRCPRYLPGLRNSSECADDGTDDALGRDRLIGEHFAQVADDRGDILLAQLRHQAVEPLAVDIGESAAVDGEQLLGQRTETGLAHVVREPFESGHARLVFDICGNNVDDSLGVFIFDLVLQGQRLSRDEGALTGQHGAADRRDEVSQRFAGAGRRDCGQVASRVHGVLDIGSEFDLPLPRRSSE